MRHSQPQTIHLRRAMNICRWLRKHYFKQIEMVGCSIASTCTSDCRLFPGHAVTFCFTGDDIWACLNDFTLSACKWIDHEMKWMHLGAQRHILSSSTSDGLPSPSGKKKVLRCPQKFYKHLHQIRPPPSKAALLLFRLRQVFYDRPASII